MEPIGNEPHGWAENEERHTSFNRSEQKEPAEREIDYADNDLAGIASGNMPDEEGVRPSAKTDDPRGFMGDFAEPQHDED
ncbi:MAG: hypothetical protein REI78_05250 [Pedobacter sp.]|nr:hypothetical protein [Pedobacter sp.]MDQ8052406.1 hypothetical protein [Pedobacter sp.]